MNANSSRFTLLVLLPAFLGCYSSNQSVENKMVGTWVSSTDPDAGNIIKIAFLESGEMQLTFPANLTLEMLESGLGAPIKMNDPNTGEPMGETEMEELRNTTIRQSGKWHVSRSALHYETNNPMGKLQEFQTPFEVSETTLKFQLFGSKELLLFRSTD